MEWLLRPLPLSDEDNAFHPARARVREYGAAFRNLAQSFSGLPSGGIQNGSAGGVFSGTDGAALDTPAKDRTFVEYAA